jgi:transcription-repair coupling factor (superfamily II helicase)
MKQMMLKYQLNKQKIINQSTKKYETARIIAAIRQPGEITAIEKSNSLPALRAKQIFVIPEENEENKVEPWRNNGNLISKSVERRSALQESKLKQTLSYAKLGFGRKKIKTICEQDILEEEMVALDEIKEKLRAKGIKFDSKKLAQGFVHNTSPHLDPLAKTLSIPANSLPSNPLYKNFPL